jgi:4-hydroxy-tetrahydrodipicolinate reductase
LTIRVGVLGAYGKMGAEVCRTVEEEPGLELVARVTRGDALDALVEGRAEVAVDFTTPQAVRDNVRFCIERDIDAVVGTTGLTQEDITQLESAVREHRASVVIAPNFALGAVLMMKLAAEAAMYFDGAEIIERHHAAKLDKPSGTSLRTARLMDAARSKPWPKPIEIHSLRLPGSGAHQEVVLGSPGQILTIRHDALDRSCYMPGVILAIEKVGSLQGVTVGLEHLLEL